MMQAMKCLSYYTWRNVNLMMHYGSASIRLIVRQGATDLARNFQALTELAQSSL